MCARPVCRQPFVCIMHPNWPRKPRKAHRLVQSTQGRMALQTAPWPLPTPVPTQLTCHAASPWRCLQPNSIEFDLAIEWRQLLGVLAHAKEALCREQAAELAGQLAVYLQVHADARTCMNACKCMRVCALHASARVLVE